MLSKTWHYGLTIGYNTYFTSNSDAEQAVKQVLSENVAIFL